MRLQFLLGEIFGGLRRNVSMVVSVVLVSMVSMFFLGSGWAMSKSALERTADSSSDMKTRFQISRNRSSSAAGPPSTPYSGPRSM